LVAVVGVRQPGSGSLPQNGVVTLCVGAGVRVAAAITLGVGGGVGASAGVGVAVSVGVVVGADVDEAAAAFAELTTGVASALLGNLCTGDNAEPIERPVDARGPTAVEG